MLSIFVSKKRCEKCTKNTEFYIKKIIQLKYNVYFCRIFHNNVSSVARILFPCQNGSENFRF